MKKNQIYCCILSAALAVTLVAMVPVHAESQENLQVTLEAFNIQKRKYIDSVMAMAPGESEAFWKVYEKYCPAAKFSGFTRPKTGSTPRQSPNCTVTFP